MSIEDGKSDQLADENFDWEQWPEKRAEITASMKRMKEQFDGLDPRPELQPLRDSFARLMADLENVIMSGDENYRQIHPNASFAQQ